MVGRTLERFSQFGLWLSLTTFAAAAPLLAQQPPPDNAKVNKAERAGGQPTAEQQKNNRSDLTITRDIRLSIVGDKTLSTYAHNVKIITRQGQVTLKGPVRTEGEKQTVEAKATQVAGVGHVTNDVSVAPAKRRAKR
jgi:hyperosmotically inducible periplasmic protein